MVSKHALGKLLLKCVGRDNVRVRLVIACVQDAAAREKLLSELKKHLKRMQVCSTMAIFSPRLGLHAYLYRI